MFPRVKSFPRAVTGKSILARHPNFWKATSASQVGGRRPTARGPGGVVTGSFRVRCLAQTQAVAPNYLDRPDERIPAHAFVTRV